MSKKKSQQIKQFVFSCENKTLTEPYDRYDIDKYYIYIASLYQNEQFLFHCANSKLIFPQSALYVNMIMLNVKMCILCLESGCEIDDFCASLAFILQDVELIKLCHKHEYKFNDKNIAQINQINKWHFDVSLPKSNVYQFTEFDESYVDAKTFSENFESSYYYDMTKMNNRIYHNFVISFLENNIEKNAGVLACASFCFNNLELSTEQFRSLKQYYRHHVENCLILDINNMSKHNKMMYLNNYLSEHLGAKRGDIKNALTVIKKFKKCDTWLSSQNYADIFKHKNTGLIIEILQTKEFDLMHTTENFNCLMENSIKHDDIELITLLLKNKYDNAKFDKNILESCLMFACENDESDIAKKLIHEYSIKLTDKFKTKIIESCGILKMLVDDDLIEIKIKKHKT